MTNTRRTIGCSDKTLRGAGRRAAWWRAFYGCVALVVSGFGASWAEAGTANETAAKPVDWRHRLEANEFAPAEKGTWTSPWVKAAFPFDELIYYWNARLPRDEGFRLYLQVEFGPGDASPWLYAGFWGKVELVTKRTRPVFDRGEVEEDTLVLKSRATAFRFKVVDAGASPLTVLPAIGAISTDNKPARKLAASEKEKASIGQAPHSSTNSGVAVVCPPSKILDVPLRLQVDVCGNPLKDRCQSAAVASAMQYFGKHVPLEHIICYTTDPEYESFGIWPRTINAAFEHGFEAYIDRFRDWEAVRRTVAQNKVILCSITMPVSDEYIAPPYKQMEGHIVALCGVTDDGRVIVTDSASTAQKAAEGGHCLQWLQADFEKIWMRNKGGVGMVICPPAGASEHLVTHLMAYPRALPAKKQEQQPQK